MFKVLINRASGLQEGFLLEVNGTYLPGGTLLWDERTHGPIVEDIDGVRTPVSDETFLEYVGKMELVLSPFPHIFFNETYIPGHFDAVLANYNKEIETWVIKYWLTTFNIVATQALVVVNNAIEATYATTPLNKILWMEKETLICGGAIWQIIKTQTGMTNEALYEIWETATQTYYQDWPN